MPSILLEILGFVSVFLFKTILSDFHEVLCFFWKAENVPRKSHGFVFIAEVQRGGLLPSSVQHLCVQLCLGVRFLITLTRTGVLGW